MSTLQQSSGVIRIIYPILSKFEAENKMTMAEESTRYEEWLTTIANTRLIYNTMDELEEMLDNHSIHNNGIKRCFNSLQKLRSAYRDLKVETDLMTDGIIHLDEALQHYQKAWNFFHNHLYRRSHPDQVAIELLSYCYPPYIREGLGAKRASIYQQVIEQNINVPFLLLLLLKAVPGYDSKEGDVANISWLFEHVMNLLEQFTSNNQEFSVLPSILRAREESNKSRLMLLYHVSRILDTYESYIESTNIYHTANYIKTSRINPDIVGYWNECEGQLLYTDFWQIEDALEYGTYFMTHWHKDAENRLTGVRYTLFIVESADGDAIYYLLHPEAMKRRMKRQPYSDADQVWYKTERLEATPSALPLHRMLHSRKWPLEISLTRCTDADVVHQYDDWLKHCCEIVKPFRQWEYDFRPNLYAITQHHLYIPSDNQGEFYKVPKSAYRGFEQIGMDDNIGTMVMNRKTYLVFDELMLYIGTSKKELQKYGIDRTNCIE